jgi:cytochrome c556
MNTQPSKPRSHATRYLFLFLLGLVIGAVATVMAVRAIQARKDHFHEGVMFVQQWHLGQLKNKVEQNRCAATDVLPNLKALRTLADDLEPAFPDLADDKRFAEHASKMRARLDAALASPPLNCAGVSTTAQGIGETCKGCHQDFR